jgi:uncharacterized protein with FMN-binding domain
MRRITMWLFSTVAALVLLFSYRTSTNASTSYPAAAAAAPATIDEKTLSPTPESSASSTTGSDDSTATSSGTKTYAGSVVSTRWGDVQVAITVADGRITDVTVPMYPTENRKDQQINARALPILRQATLAAQSADIDTVSGATVTSDGYRESLQAALDAAHLS